MGTPVKFPIWPGVVLLAGSVLCFGIACSIFNHQSTATANEIGEAVNYHSHALTVYNGRCRPAKKADFDSCKMFYAALHENERAITACLNAPVRSDRQSQQLADLRASVKALRKFD